MDNRGAINLNSGVINGDQTLVNTLEGTISGRGTILTVFSNEGLLLAQGGALKIQSNFPNSGTIAIGGLGSSLVGGVITNFGTIRAGGFLNEGTMTFSGGISTINGDIVNSAAHQIRVAYNPAIFTGLVTNNGIFKNTSTSITFAGTYIENGTFISDPADNFF